MCQLDYELESKIVIYHRGDLLPPGPNKNYGQFTSAYEKYTSVPKSAQRCSVVRMYNPHFRSTKAGRRPL